MLGHCDGTTESVSLTDSVDDCIGNCNDNSACEWWTFDSVSKLCHLSSTCWSVADSSATYGQRDCSASAGEPASTGSKKFLQN